LDIALREKDFIMLSKLSIGLKEIISLKEGIVKSSKILLRLIKTDWIELLTHRRICAEKTK
jgi:hypothetical protein